MKKILFILSFLISFVASSQVKQVYPQYGGTWNKLYLRDSGAFRLPIKIASTKDFNNSTPDSGQVYYSPTDSSIKYYTGFQWLGVGSTNIYNSNGILTGNRTLTGLNNTYSLNHDSLASWRAGRNN